jgi:hypothetical protein
VLFAVSVCERFLLLGKVAVVLRPKFVMPRKVMVKLISELAVHGRLGLTRQRCG